MKGKLYLIPAPLGENATHSLPVYTVEILNSLQHFIAERAKTARHYIKAVLPDKSLPDLEFFELNEHTDAAEVAGFLKPALKGLDMGLLSEAGCPGVADPGARAVRLAHELGIEVVPLVGPSSILLALMASGMNGQRFTFHGYLSAKRPEMARDLKRLEQLSARQDQTEVFIEAPYRNEAVLETALQSLDPGTWFGVAADLTLPSQFILTRRIADWRKLPKPELHKRPVVFMIYAGKG